MKSFCDKKIINNKEKENKNEKSITGENKKKAQPIQKLIDTRKEREGSEREARK